MCLITPTESTQSYQKDHLYLSYNGYECCYYCYFSVLEFDFLKEFITHPTNDLTVKHLYGNLLINHLSLFWKFNHFIYLFFQLIHFIFNSILHHRLYLLFLLTK